MSIESLFAPGTIAPLDGGHARSAGFQPANLRSDGSGRGESAENRRQDAGATDNRAFGSRDGAAENRRLEAGATENDFGPNNERLEELKPKLVAALRELVNQFRQEGIVARRHEIRRIRQARMFWQGLQYAWWNPNDMNWQLPYQSSFGLNDDRALEEMPRYQFVTNIYQGFGLSFIAVMSQDVPSVRFYPQSAQNEADIAAAKAASEAAKLVEQNNRVQQLLTGVAYYLWTDGKIGGYVRYVADGQRFGFHDEDVIEEGFARLGENAYVCPVCGAETPVAPAGIDRSAGFQPAGLRGEGSNGGESAENRRLEAGATGRAGNNPGATMLCSACGAALSEENFKPAETVAIPRVVETRRVPNGQEVITIVGGLELNTPVWANEMHEYPYLQWQMEVHRAKLKASYPHAADKIQMGAAPLGGAEDIYARASRVAVSQGLPSTHPGDTLYNLITFSRTWIRPWSFFALEDKPLRDELLQLFPHGCYCAFAGDTYCESRNEIMDDHWRVMHALPGDGQNRPGVGDSLVQVQERYNTLSNIQAETYEFGIPPIYADPQVLDFDALQNQVAEPAAHYPARAKPGQPLASGFFQPAPAQVPPDMLRHQQDLVGPVAQFLTGLFPAVFGGETRDQKTATGYAIARDQALGRLGLVWRRLKQFYADLMLLGVDSFRKNRPEDAEIPFLGADGAFESKWIRLADLKGNIQAYPEADEQFPRLKSQQRAVIQQLMASTDPVIQEALSEPANLGFIKSVIGLTELVVPGEDSRNKQLREIQQLLASAPIAVAPAGFSPAPAPALPVPSGVAGSAVEVPAGPGFSGTGTSLPAGLNRSAAGPAGFSVAPASLPANLPSAGSARSDAATALDAEAQNCRQDAGATPGATPGATLGEELSVQPGVAVLPSVPVDDLLDNHIVEFQECKRWANSDAGQVARVQNSLGFANVRAHAAAHLRALTRHQGQQIQTAPGVSRAPTPSPRPAAPPRAGK